MSTGLFLVGQVAAVLVQRLVGALRRLGRDPLAAANARQGSQDGIAGQAVALQQAGHVAGAVVGQGQQQVLGRHIVVVHLAGRLFGPVQRLLHLARQANLGRPPIDLGLAVQFALHLLSQHTRLQAQALHDLGYDAVRLAQQGQQQVLAFDLSMAVFAGQALGLDQGFLCFFSKTVQIHSPYYLTYARPRPGSL
jgi:hypothetical protein